MKIYLVSFGIYDNEYVAGAFSSLEKANEYILKAKKENKLWYTEYDKITTMTLDDPDKSE